MVGTKPMANLVGSGTAQVVRYKSAPWNASGVNVAAVEEAGAGGLSRREVAVSESTAAKVLEVDIESLIVTLAKSLSHGTLILVVIPSIVGSASNPKEVESNTGGAVVGIQDVQLIHRTLRSSLAL